MSFFTTLRDYFFPPTPSFEEDFPPFTRVEDQSAEEDADHPTEEVMSPEPPVERNPLTDARSGDTFAGIYGGVRHFIGFDSATGEALFTRANRPQILRESPEKWSQFLKTATVVSTEK